MEARNSQNTRLTKKKTAAEFWLCAGHDCLGTHLHCIGICPNPYSMLSSLHESRDRNHLGQCTALFTRKECGRYWEIRTKMMENFASFLLLFLWLLLTIRTFVFALNVVYCTYSIYSVIVLFYFYWSHTAMINNQCTCH